MKFFFGFIQVLAVMVALAGCHTNVIDETAGGAKFDDEKGVTTINGTIQLGTFGEGQYDDIIINSLIDDVTLMSQEYSVKVMSNGTPQLLYVTDSNDNIMMLSRGFSQHDLGEVSAKTTALALVSMQPLFLSRSEEEYYKYVELIEKSSYFQPYLTEVEKSINNRRDIFDTDNTELLITLNNLLEDLCSAQTATRAIVEGINSDPFVIDKNGTVLTVYNKGFRPTYECKVLYGARERPDFNKMILANESYGYLDIGTSIGNRLGPPTKFELYEEGEYRFEFNCTTDKAIEDFSKRLWADALTIIGVDGTDVKYFATAMNAWKDVTSLAIDPSTNIGDVLLTVGGSLFQAGLEGIPERAAKVLAKVVNVLNALKGAANESARIIWGLSAPKIVQFCICSYDGDLSSCTVTKLEIVRHTNNQTGFSNEKLFLPIQVLVLSEGENGNGIQSIYHKIKFEVVSGGGYVSHAIAPTNDNGFAETAWTLGKEGEQKVRAVAIDMVTGVEVSDPVYFYAELKEDTALTVTLGWAKGTGNMDIDLHVTDPYGEEIAYYNPTSASGGWLDRDDVIGPGPEHIYWTNAPAGVYLVQVHYFDSESHAVTSYNVSINVNGEAFGPFSGSISYDKTVTIGTITMPEGSVLTRSAPIFTPIMETEQNKKIYPKK